jgi:hypothetical protein
LGAGIADNPDAAAQAWGVKESSSGVTMATQQIIHAAVLHGIG